MNPETRDYIRFRTEQSRETLGEAKVLFDSQFLRGAVNRLYYACFYAVAALLWTEGLSSAKHSGVRSLFDRHWVKTGNVPVALGRLYHTLFRFRHQGDYERVTFEADKVKEILEQACEFVELLNKLSEERVQ